MIDAALDPERPALLFGLTPPRASSTPEQISEIATATLTRLESLPVDGLVVYDLEDESDRNPLERPFPYLPTMDPAVFVGEYLGGWDRPAIVYRSVGKYESATLADWLRTVDVARTAAVFVGASSRDKAVRTTLKQAHRLRDTVGPGLRLGGVAIPERHQERGDEHLRMLRKQQSGVTFFVTQVVYDANACKNLISDYHYLGLEQGVEAAPLIFTFSVCGTPRTLEFLQWLGVTVPRWVRNELLHSEDTLEVSARHAAETAADLAGFCRTLGVPFGFNIESVSNRKAEIEASIALVRQIASLLGR